MSGLCSDNTFLTLSRMLDIQSPHSTNTPVVDSECDRVCHYDCVWRILVYEDRNEGHSTLHGRGQGGFIESNSPQKTDFKKLSLKNLEFWIIFYFVFKSNDWLSSLFIKITPLEQTHLLFNCWAMDHIHIFYKRPCCYYHVHTVLYQYISQYVQNLKKIVWW